MRPGMPTQSHPTDIVFFEGLRVYGYHGVHPEERSLGQWFEIDVQIETSTREAGEHDRLEATVSYSDLMRRVNDVVTAEAKQLIEALAESIATAVLAHDERIAATTVTVRKPDAPVKGIAFGAVGVTIRREREGVRR